MSRRKDPLADAKVEHGEDPNRAQNVREQIVELVAAAIDALPDGVPETSPFATMGIERMHNEANRFDLGGAAGGLKVDELRLVLEHARQKMLAAPVAGVPADAVPMPQPQPVPPSPPNVVAFVGLAPSPVGKWRATEAKNCSINGTFFHVAAGAVIDILGYGHAGVQTMANQGLKLEPLTE